MTNVLVTGAGGFVGKACLNDKPEHVKALAFFGPTDHTGWHAGSDLKQDQFDSLVGDIADTELLAKACIGVDTIIHLAGSASVATSFQHPFETLRGHTMGACVLANAAQRAGVRRLIHVSSAEVYGRPEQCPVNEAATPAPRSPYAAAKIGAEAVFTAAAHSSDLEVVILRPFSIYGPGQRTDGLLDRIVSQALSDEPVRLYNLKPCRDYVHIDDVVRALWLVVGQQASFPLPHIFNIASGKGTSVAELAAIVLNLVGRSNEFPIEAGQDRQNKVDIPELIGCTDKSKQKIGWSAEIDLVTGLKQTIDAYRSSEIT